MKRCHARFDGGRRALDVGLEALNVGEGVNDEPVAATFDRYECWHRDPCAVVIGLKREYPPCQASTGAHERNGSGSQLRRGWVASFLPRHLRSTIIAP